MSDGGFVYSVQLGRWNALKDVSFSRPAMFYQLIFSSYRPFDIPVRAKKVLRD